MRKILILFIFFASLNAETFSRDELLDMGCYRIGDLFHHVNTANFTSVDGFHYHMNILNYNRQNTNFYKVFIDDHQFSANVLEGTQLNWLPIDMNSVDSIVIIDKNCIYKGEFLSDGAIQIFTKKNEQVISANAGGNWGNESGDPGPLKYTELETENVDKIGQNLNGFLSINIDENYISGFVNYRQHTYRDPRILNRIQESMGNKYWIGMDQFSAGEMINLKNHSLIVSQVYGKNCFYYHPLYKTEVPSDIYYDHVSYAGNYEVFGLDIDLRSNWENYKTEYIENNFERELNWNLKSIKNNLLVIKQFDMKKITSGIDYDIIDFNDQEYSRLTGLIGFAYTNSKIHNQFDLTLSRFNDRNKVDYRFKAAITSMLTFEEKNQLNSNFYIQSFSSSDVLDLKYFLKEQLNIWNEYHFINEQVPNGLNVGLNVSVEMKELDAVYVKIGIPANYFSNVIESKTLFDAGISNLTDRSYLIQNYFSANYGVDFETKIFPNKPLSVMVFCQFLRFLYDDHFDLLENDFYSLKSIVSFKYKPAKSFSTIAKINHWKNNFRNLHYIEHKKSEITTIDISLIKYIWDNRFSANLMLRNLMNNRYWLHDAGVAFDRSLYFGVNCWL